MELYKKYRPKTLDGIVGQDSIIKSIKGKLQSGKIPHTLLFFGPSGCGKTTLARIISKELGCGKYDFSEVNCADFRGIDMVRDIRSYMHQAPIHGSCRIWLIDEAHKLTGDAQNAFLKMLEDTPKQVYFMLATTDPQKLYKTIRTRCSEIAVKPIDDNLLSSLISSVCKKEEKKISTKVISKIVEYSEGSARKALVLLDQIIELDNEKDMIEIICSTATEEQTINLIKALLTRSTKWKTIAGMLKELAKEEPETIRRQGLGYARAVLLSGSPQTPNAYIILDAFRDHWYDSGHAGLAAACYEIIEGDKIQ